MSKVDPEKIKPAGHIPAAKSHFVIAPSVVGGADKQYLIVFEKKAMYKKPSFAR